MTMEAPHLDPGQLPDEDSARANIYALIGRLFYDVPDSKLLAEICSSGEAAGEPESGSLASAWAELHRACKSALPDAVRQEYDALFIGVGRAQLTLYTSRYIGGMSADKHLVRLREQLGAWGLGRRDNVYEVEDHISGVCDVMRYLIEQNQSLEDQKLFFSHFVYPGAMPLCDALVAANSADFYKKVAILMRAFLEMENIALEMIE